ncbi:hypothetical protein, partial [Aromatoleum toluclasticum]|uniref:hypothetical protein n=1 Tax=Aromatoleum toluclasticum TaxID=92003 RepID=UPI001E4CD8CC
GKVGRIDAMGSDEAVRVERFSDLGQHLGMELAKSSSMYPIDNSKLCIWNFTMQVAMRMSIVLT